MNNERVTPKKIVLLFSFFFLFSFVISCKNAFVNSNLPDSTEKTSYTVTFDKNHGDADGWKEADPKTVTVVPPKTAVGSLPAEPKRTGWEFISWNTERNGDGTLFTASTPVTKNVTVYARWQETGSTDPGLLTVEINPSGRVGDDSVTLSPPSGEAGDTVTITYTVANSKTNNRLVFSGTTTVIDSVNSAGNGTRTYVIDEDDATEGLISINAVFAHSDKEIDTIAFSDSQNESKTYGDTPFTKAVANTGAGSGAISYSSGTPSVATVNSSTGLVTILSAGSSVITATKAPDATYDEARAMYTLSVAHRQLGISNPNVTTTKTYDGTTAADVVIGTPANVVSGDTVNVTAVASYNSANVPEANLITVVYTITGSSASNYTKPADYTIDGSISKADGVTLASAPTASSVTSSSITVRAVNPPAGLTVEYAVSTAATPTPASGWQTGTDFTGLTPETDYYIHARVQGNANYNEGPAVVSAKITTPAPPVIPRTTIVDFEADSTGKTYTSTGGNGSATLSVVVDPLNAGQKSLQINVTGYNRAAIIPIHLPYALQNYQTFSFRINILSGTDLTNKPVMVYAAGNTSSFVNYGFGNPAGGSDPQMENLLAGQTAAVDFSSATYTNKWTSFTITLNPGASISNLKGDIFIAIGINSNSATYLIDDLTFTLKDNFEPPIPLPAPQPPSVGAVVSGNYRNMFEEMGKTEAAITAKVNTTWNRLFGSDENYKVYYEVAGDMAYIYDSGNDDVRSEGMSYGMMMAVQMNKQTEFNKLWRWAKTNMYNETNQKNCRGYFAWQCGTNGNKKDAGCAPDGEFYFATALLFAHARWGSGSGVLDYRKHAMQLLYDMLHRTSPPDNYGEPAMFRDTDYNGAGKYMTVFQPQGSAGQFTDPSYHLPAFYEVWAIELEKDANAGNLHGIWSNAAAMKTDAAFYRSAVTASRGLFKNAVNATTGLGPDYSHFTGAAYGSDAHSHFEYDAFRTVMNAAMDYSWFAVDSWQKTYADTLQSFFHSKGVNSYTALWTLTGTSRGGDHSPGLIACNSVASLAATHQRAWDFLDDFWEISMTPGKYRYYDGCLYMLGLLHVTGNFKAYLSGNTVIIPSSSISPTTATFDKKTDLQADITVTMTLNGNDFVSIQNGGTTLSGVTDYTRSGDTVTLKKEYFAAQPVGTTTLTFYFSGGVSRTIVITIKETSEGGGGTAGTKYDFSTDTVTATFTPGSNAGSTATVMPATNGGVLNVNVKGANDLVLIPFDLGTTTLADYASIKIEIASISGDTNFKDLYIFVPNLSTGTYPSGDFNGVTNMRIAYQGNALTGANSWNSYTLTLNSTYATTAYTGEVKLAFGFRGINNSGLVYQIRSVELVLK